MAVNNFTFVATVPATNNNPSTDYTTMAANNVSDLAIWQQDHVGYNTDNGGTHLQCTFFTTSSPTVSDNRKAILYTKVGAADNASANIWVANKAGNFNMNQIKSSGCFTGVNTNVAVGLLTSVNTTSCTSSSNGKVYTLPLTGVKNNGVTFVFLNSSDPNYVLGWSYSGTTLVINAYQYIVSGSTSVVKIAAAPNGVQISYIVLQV